jgi:hypothetical protein
MTPEREAAYVEELYALEMAAEFHRTAYILGVGTEAAFNEAASRWWDLAMRFIRELAAAPESRANYTNRMSRSAPRYEGDLNVYINKVYSVSRYE